MAEDTGRPPPLKVCELGARVRRTLGQPERGLISLLRVTHFAGTGASSFPRH